MKQYSTFHFSGYSWNHHTGKISLRYSLDDEISFEETILLPEPVSDARLKEKEWEIERLLFALHLIGGISYYKTCLPKTIKVSSGMLSPNDARFWAMVYERGLGEFFYRNNIEFRGLLHFPVNEHEEVRSEPKTLLRRKKAAPEMRRILVPVGGGKDSIVTTELLRSSGAQLTLLRIGAHPIIDELSHVAGLPMLTVRRQLSPALFKLNEEGALNGHVPITAFVSILSALVALLYDFDAVAMSNEGSANEGNLEFKGMEINHQWSKSLEFEKALRRHLTESVGTEIEYFSALRPFSELKIAEIFCAHPQYFGVTTSCNKNWKILSDTQGAPRWCRECPKCAFVFSCLAAFLPKKKLQEIFGSILYEDEKLLDLYRELLGIKDSKPFECVGTPREVSAAFLLAGERGDLNGTLAMNMFQSEALPTIKDPRALITESLKADEKNHCIPKSLLKAILDA